ncbi:TATA-binding protein interacting (TIP20) domain-containing protein [Plasmodiophora brassicae]
MATSTQRIRGLLERTRHHDKDERFMATSDLTTELDAIDAIEKGLQGPVRDAIVSQLSDQSNDVQAVAVKCLSSIVKKFDIEQTLSIVTKLGELTLVGKDDIRDIYALGIRTIICSSPDETGPRLSAAMLPVFFAGLRPRPGGPVVSGLPSLAFSVPEPPFPIDVQIICVDLLKELLKRYGSVLVNYHGAILDQVVTLLDNPGRIVRKHAIATCGVLVPIINLQLFEHLMQCIINRIEGSGSIALAPLYTYIQTIGVICRASGELVGPWLVRIVPQLIRFLGASNQDASEEHPQVFTELKENCLQAFDAILNRCPHDVIPFLPAVIPICCTLSQFDPNFIRPSGHGEPHGDNHDRMETDATFDDVDDDEGWDDADAAEFPDDDDEAWKVRKAALVTLTSFIRSAYDKVGIEILQPVVDTVVSRVEDRDCNVKRQALLALLELVTWQKSTLTSQFVERVSPTLTKLLTPEEDVEVNVVAVAVITEISSLPSLQVNDAATEWLRSLIRFVTQTVQGGHAHTLLVPLLNCIRTICLRESSRSIHDIDELVADIAAVSARACSTTLPKVKDAALQLCAAVIVLVNPNHPSLQNILQKLLNAIHSCLVLQDVDRDVKQSAINALSVLLGSFASSTLFTGNEVVGQALSVLSERLSNEESVTRQAVLQALLRIASTNVSLDMSSFLKPASLLELLSLLRKKSQSLRYLAFEALSALLRTRASSVDERTLRSTLLQIIACIDECDTRLAQLAIELLTSLISEQPTAFASGADANDLLAHLISFSQSRLLSGVHRSALVSLLKSLVVLGHHLGIAILQRDSLFDAFRQLMASSGHFDRDVVTNLSMVLATIVTAPPDPNPLSTVPVLMDMMQLQHSTQLVSIAAIGEIGRHIDISGVNGLLGTMFSKFDDSHEDIKWAASKAVGRIAARNIAAVLPMIITRLKRAPSHRYLLLKALKEVIVLRDDLADDQLPAELAPLLFEYCNTDDEGIRGIIAHCLGALCNDGETVRRALTRDIVARIRDPSPRVRWVIIGALRYVNIDKEFGQHVPAFLSMLDDADLETRRHALLTVNALLRGPPVPGLLEQVVPVVLPAMYRQMAQDPSLVRTVDYGPFKRKVDDEVHPDLVDTRAEDFVCCLERSLTDDRDVQLTAYHILAHMASHCPRRVLEMLPRLTPMFTQGIKEQIRLSKGDGGDDSKDVLRAAVRAFITFNSIRGIAESAEFSSFESRVCKTPLLQEIRRSIVAEISAT